VVGDDAERMMEDTISMWTKPRRPRILPPSPTLTTIGSTRKELYRLPQMPGIVWRSKKIENC
jgi:hypothetical protein